MVDQMNIDIYGKGTVYLPHACIHIHSQIQHRHKLDWMWNSSWKEVNCNMHSSQN